MKKLFIVALALVAGASLSTIQAGKKNKKAPKPSVQLVTGSDSLSYTAGYVLADIVRDRFLAGLGKEVEGSDDSLQMRIAYQGLIDALKGDTALFKNRRAEEFLNGRVVAIRKAKEEKLKKAGKDFLEENAKKEGIVTLPSGVQYKVIKEGTGAIPADTSRVKVHYEGRTLDGKVFDSSYKRGNATDFRANQVIKGWTEALTHMPAGSTWEVYIPQELAYGERQQGADIKPFSMLIFKIELLEVDPKK